MEEIKVYKTEDNKFYTTKEEAENHEKLIELLNVTYTNADIQMATDAIVFGVWKKKDFIKWQYNKLNELKKDLMELWRE